MDRQHRPVTVVGILGSQLDAVAEDRRWERWRPTVSLFQHEDLLVDRLELLYQRPHEALAELVTRDIDRLSPETSIHRHPLDLDDPWDLEEVFGRLLDFCESRQFDPQEEDLLVHITTGSHVMQICLFLLTEAHYLPGRLLQSAPPKRRDSLGRYQIIDLDLSRYDRLAARFHREHREATAFLKSGIATRSATYNRLIDRIEQVAVASRHPILLTGPTGAGKSKLGRRIYELKARRGQVEGSFVEVNCATIRGDGAMSALFGHVAGAFTGASHNRPGLLRSADRGVLFLDEIGELGFEEQAMLLRALEEKRFLPVGSDSEVASDFQLIAGSNRDLARAVIDGRFREDLLARIDLWTFELPGLRQRREDIEPNIDFALQEMARSEGRRVTFNREARDAFASFAQADTAQWSANFRDLNASLLRMATLSPGGRIGVAEVEEEIGRLLQAWAHSAVAKDAGQGDLEPILGAASKTLDRFERVQLADVVRVCQQSRSLSEAGRTLFAASRRRKKTANDADRLRKYLARFGLDWQAVVRG